MEIGRISEKMTQEGTNKEAQITDCIQADLVCSISMPE